ncbi:MAG TPA: hypothetical protein VJP60_07855 [Rhizomicrobium sp.]|nr:hypothetical protein [Rhizomicrobium sp.]
MRTDATSRLDRLEKRLNDAEQDARLAADMLDHALEKFELAGSRHVVDQRRAAEVEQRCARLEESLARLAACGPDAQWSHRLNLLEQAVADQAIPRKYDETIGRMESLVQEVVRRLDGVEKAQEDLQRKQRALMFGPAEPQACEPPHAEPAPYRFETAGAPFEVDAQSDLTPDRDAGLEDDYFEEGDDIAQDRDGNFLAWARATMRSAPERPRSSYFFPVLGAIFVVVVLATTLMLSVREKGRVQESAAAATVPAMKTFSDSEPPAKTNNDTLFVVAPEGNDPPEAGGGSYVPPSERGGISLDRLIEMAESGDAKALTVLGLRALDGSGAAAVNLPDAVKYLSRAAEAGQPVAQFRLGTLYEHADGVGMDTAKAAHWYQLAAEHGNRKAMHNLGVFYASGALGKKDLPQAARWFAKAASLGLTDSQFNLAFLNEHGYGVTRSLVAAYKWYSIAAASGDKESKARAALLQARLSASDKAAASKAAADFRVTPLDIAANVPPPSNGL